MGPLKVLTLYLQVPGCKLAILASPLNMKKILPIIMLL